MSTATTESMDSHCHMHGDGTMHCVEPTTAAPASSMDSHCHMHGDGTMHCVEPTTAAPASSMDSHCHMHGDGTMHCVEPTTGAPADSHCHMHGDGTMHCVEPTTGAPADSHCHMHGDGTMHCDGADGDNDHGHSHGGGGGHGHSHGCASVEGDYMLALHIAAIFIVLVASMVGTLIPILGKRVPALRLPAYVYAVGKAMATGVVLAVAMIHMINHAAIVFAAECVPASFSGLFEGWAFLFAMIAAIVMHAIDGTIGWIVEGWAARAAADASSTEPSSDYVNKEHVVRVGEVAEPAAARHGGDAECVGHQHGVAVPEDIPRAQRIVAAVCMEFGVTLHSVFVGLALAVANGPQLRALIIALVFHQLFEGLAMGARLADAAFKLSLELVLMLVFSFSAPIGIAAGIGAVMAARDALSGATYALVSAILDSVCGGILLYIAFNLLFVDLPRDIRVHCGADSKRPVLKRIVLYAGLWIGAGVMAIIGKWL